MTIQLNNLTKIAALPGSGAGCMATLPPEALTREDYLKAAKAIDANVAEGLETIKMRAPYFAQALAGEPADGSISAATMEKLAASLARMRGKGRA